MTLFIDTKYIDIVASQLRNFKKKRDYLWNYSCPMCGDSKKNKNTARGYIFRNEDHLSYKCHKCGESGPFGSLIKFLDPTVYKQYIYEVFLEKRGDEQPKKEKKVVLKKEYRPTKPTALIGCPSISTLGPDHPARVYIENRKIPKALYREIYWTDDFPALVDKVLPTHQFKNLMKEGRIIIPFLDRQQKLLAIQGRSLAPKSKLRYITIKTFEDAPRVYGLHRLSLLPKRVYCLEGPFDSMFLPNALAMAGGDIPKGLATERTVIVYDNEPRKNETCMKMEAALNGGYRVCIWPDTIKTKDVNLMVVKEGISPDKIRVIIDQNSFTGLEGQFRLGRWRKDKLPEVKKPKTGSETNEPRKENGTTT